MTPNLKPSSSPQSPEQTETETSYPALTLEDIKSIAPVNRNGGPDLYNHMPTRLVPLEEAKQRKWGYFYLAAPCRYGHVAPRYVSNPRQCVDCVRVKRGKTTVGEKSGGVRPTNKKNVGNAAGVIVNVTKPEQLDTWERRFLEAYAHNKDFKIACTASGVTEAQILARISYNPNFARSFDTLEEKIGVKRVNTSEGYEWTAEKYDKLIEVYINSGDMASARDSIGVTAFEYFQELARSSSFAQRVKEADPLAHLALEERAIQLALAGNDKLLQKVLSVKKPEYRENIKVDMNVTEKLNDRQLESRLFRLLDKIRPITVIEGEYSETPETRTVGVIEAPRGNGSEEVSS